MHGWLCSIGCCVVPQRISQPLQFLIECMTVYIIEYVPGSMHSIAACTGHVHCTLLPAALLGVL